jgi:hypothetical protein
VTLPPRQIASASAAWRALPNLYADRQVTPPAADAPLATGAGGRADALSDDASQERTSKPRKALLLSLLLPGAGELYSGARGRATGFFISEGAIWAHFAGWEIAGHLRKSDYIEQAQLNAGVGTDSDTDEYWRLVGAYERSSGSGPGSYEEALRREARDQFPTDPAAQDAYVAQRLPSGSRAWAWSSDALRASYRSTREEASRAYDRAQLSIAFAILNRIASAIDTQILHSRDRRGAASADDAGVHVLAGMTPDGGGRLALQSRF